jgi:hypothetical protein
VTYISLRWSFNNKKKKQPKYFFFKERKSPQRLISWNGVIFENLSFEMKLDKNILMKTNLLAPIEVEILLWRCSPQKIGTDSGISS